MKSRILIVDVLRGAAIIMMVLGHVLQFYIIPNTFTSNHLWKFITLVNMPLFILLSGFSFGYTLKDDSRKWWVRVHDFTEKKADSYCCHIFRGL